MKLYEELGVRKVINCDGRGTLLGGSIVDPRVMDAMKEASQSYVNMIELMEKTGQIIADVTGAEAGLVTAGSSAALLLGAASCIMRGSGLEKFEVQPMERIDSGILAGDYELQLLDGERVDLIQSARTWFKKETGIQRLPGAPGLKNEIIIQKTHRDVYDHMYKVAGGHFVEVGTKNGCSQGELETAITEKTGAIAFFACHEDAGLSLEKVVEIARKHDVPVIVDAASEVPPRSNLNKYIAKGADLVYYSGGKGIRGPNDTGMLCGRRDLIKMATLQSFSYCGIGRATKVDRTQIVGFIVALRLFLDEDEEAEFRKWGAKAHWVAEQLKNVSGILSSVVKGRTRARAEFTIDEDCGISASDLALKLRKGAPSIWVGYRPHKNERDRDRV